MATISFFNDFNINEVDKKTYKNGNLVPGGLPNSFAVILEPDLATLNFQGFGFELNNKGEPTDGTITFVSFFPGNDSDLAISASSLNVDVNDVVKLAKKGNVEGIFEIFFGGNDTIPQVPTPTPDNFINGFGGTDTVIYSGNRDEYTVVDNNGVVTVTDNTPGQSILDDDGTDELRNVEIIQFADQSIQIDTSQSGGDDKEEKSKNKGKEVNVVDGTADAEQLDGTDGDDLIEGLGGNDILNGLGGKDTLEGGQGDDTMNGGDGKDMLFGDAGNDIYILGKGDKAFEDAGNGDADEIRAEKKIKLGDNFENATLLGQGKGKIKGNDADNVLVGNNGDTKIDGGDGDDVIDAGGGRNKVKGGDGEDIFVFPGGIVNNLDDNTTVIRDFEVGEDRISLTGTTIANFDQVLALANDGKKGVEISGDGGVFVLSKVDLEELSASDFIFPAF